MNTSNWVFNSTIKKNSEFQDIDASAYHVKQNQSDSGQNHIFSHIQIVNLKSIIICVFLSVCVYACEYSKMKPIIFHENSKHDKKNES